MKKKLLLFSIVILGLPVMICAQFSIHETIFIGEDAVLSTSADTRVHPGHAVINNNGTLTIHPGTSFTVGNEAILLNRGVVNGDVTFEKILTSPSFEEPDPDGHWVGLSAPAEGSYAGPGGLLNRLWTQGFPGANYTGTDFPSNVIEYNYNNELAFCYDEEDIDERWCAPESSDLTPGLGFFVYLFERSDPGDASSAIDFDEPISITGQNSTFDGSSNHLFPALSGDDDGWNFLGNPFGTPLDWGASTGWTKNDLTEFAYIWDPAEKQYLVTSDDGVVSDILAEPVLAPFQAFWVQAAESAASPELAMSNEVFTTAGDNTQYFKQPEIPAASLTLEIGDFQSTTAFRFSDRFKPGLTDKDARFLTPMAHSFAYLYTVHQNTPVYLKSLPENSDGKTEMPLLVGGYLNLVPYSGEALIRAEGFDTFSPKRQAILHDHQTGTSVNLTEEPEYRFVIEPSGTKKVEKLHHLRASGSPVFYARQAQGRFTLVFDPDPDPESPDVLPEQYILHQNYPNPFNPATNIRFELPKPGEVSLVLYDLAGRKIAVLVDESRPAGVHTITFEAGALSSGVYIYRLEAGGTVLTRKLTLIK